MYKIAIRTDVLAGSDLFEVISEGIDIAKKLDVPLLITFNGCRLRLHPWDGAPDKCHEYHRWEAAGGLLQERPKIQPC